MPQGTKRTRRRGFTLVELLVVIGVIVVLLAIAIPAMRFGMEDRNIREASRAINAYCVLAQSQAAEKNRPVGIWIERRDGSPGEAIRLFIAEVPPPYIGDTFNARTQIQSFPTFYRAYFSQQSSSLIPFLISQGDVIRFDYKGPYYRITSDPSLIPPNQAPFLEFVLDGQVPPSSTGTQAPPMLNSAWLPYQILRKAQKTSIASLELPKSASIDLNVSGLGPNSGAWPQGVTAFAPDAGLPAPPINDTTPVVIMFSPSGRIDHVRVHGQIIVPQETVHLLIGREALIDQDDRTKNLGGDGIQDDEKESLTNLWVSIGAQTGSVTTEEMATTSPTSPGGSLANRVQASRKFANQKHLMGGG